MGAFANMLSGANGLFEGDQATDGGFRANLGQMLQGVGGVGSQIAKIGGDVTRHPMSPNGTSPVPMAAPAPISIAPAVSHAMQGNVAGNNPIETIASPEQTSLIPTQTSPVAPTSVNVPSGIGEGVGIIGKGSGEINPGDLTSVYGVDTGTMLKNLFNSLSPTSANSTAQAIIAANAPNVARGSADLNTALAAGGISPSSSVSAIENANYEGQVQQQNLAELANINLTEQERQQQLLETLLSDQKQRQTDSSGWSIFGDIMQGIGDIGSLVAL